MSHNSSIPKTPQPVSRFLTPDNPRRGKVQWQVNQSTAMGLTMAIQASGAFTKITVLEELDMPPIIAAAQKAAKVYKPAG